MAGLGSFKSYQLYNQANWEKTLLMENLEAISGTENETITNHFCHKSSGSFGAGYICPSGTITNIGTPSIPIGPISLCPEKTSGFQLFSQMGYCYTKNK